MGQQDRNPDNVTGRNAPSGDGGVGDEQVDAINDDGMGKATGQDHSTEHHEMTEPRQGVGAFQESWDTGSDIAHIEGEEDVDANDNYERRPRPLNQ